MPKIILINGKKRSGKDYLANALKLELEQQGHTAEIMSFATPIKEIVADTFGISLELLDDYKNNSQAIDVAGENLLDFRVLLQRFGTEAMKSQFGNEVWVDLLKDKVNKSTAEYILVPDFRFLCEDMHKEFTVMTVHIFNNNIVSDDTHASENELNYYSFDIMLDNTGYKLDKNDVQKALYLMWRSYYERKNCEL